MDVLLLQNSLKAAGYLVTATGVMDQQTHYALQEFETDREIGNADGELDAESELALLQLIPALTPLASAFAALGVGSKAREWAMSFESARTWAATGGTTLSSDSYCLLLGNVLHESACLRRLEENLNYTPAGLLNIFGTRFSTHTAELYGRTKEHKADQRMIANIAYAGKIGNGDVDSGDGWAYRGVGPIQLTGKANHEHFEKDTGIRIRDTRLPEYMAKSAVHFWITHGCDAALTKKNDATLACKRVNAKLLGLPERMKFYNYLRENTK